MMHNKEFRKNNVHMILVIVFIIFSSSIINNLPSIWAKYVVLLSDLVALAALLAMVVKMILLILWSKGWLEDSNTKDKWSSLLDENKIIGTVKRAFDDVKITLNNYKKKTTIILFS